MKVILLKDVASVGKKYEVKNVAAGYANNYLIPNHLVEIATKKKIKYAEERQREIEGERRVQEELLAKNFKEVSIGKEIYFASQTVTIINNDNKEMGALIYVEGELNEGLNLKNEAVILLALINGLGTAVLLGQQSVEDTIKSFAYHIARLK